MVCRAGSRQFSSPVCWGGLGESARLEDGTGSC